MESKNLPSDEAPVGQGQREGDLFTEDASSGEHGSPVQAVKDKVGGMTDQVKDKAGVGKEKAGEVVLEAEIKTDAGIQKSAEGLKKAAEKVRATAEEQTGPLGTITTQAADVLEKGSDYLELSDTEQLLQGVEALVRKRPVESLLVAAGVGFLLSRAVR